MTDLEIEKLAALLEYHYNLFHADLISRAITDGSISIDAFKEGIKDIGISEKFDDDTDEFIPKEWEEV